MKKLTITILAAILSINAFADKMVTVTWESIQDAQSYSINVDSGVGVTRVLRTENTFQKISLTDGRSYTIFVYANFKDGIGPKSNIIKINTKSEKNIKMLAPKIKIVEQ